MSCCCGKVSCSNIKVMRTKEQSHVNKFYIVCIKVHRVYKLYIKDGNYHWDITIVLTSSVFKP